MSLLVREGRQAPCRSNTDKLGLTSFSPLCCLSVAHSVFRSEVIPELIALVARYSILANCYDLFISYGANRPCSRVGWLSFTNGDYVVYVT